jgi:hypothetical protein
MMADYVRPAARAHWFDDAADDDRDYWYDPELEPERRISALQNQGLVSPYPADSLSPHPFCAPTAAEADAFWRAGGFDDLANEG